MTKIAILGGGSWGTALSIVLSRSHKPHEISLWMRDPALTYAVNKTRVNELYLPGCPIPTEVAVTTELAHALAHADIIVGATPSAYARAIYSRALPSTEKTTPVFVSATKGLEPSTHLRMTEVLSQVMADKSSRSPVAILSGPSFALEAARGDPTAVVVASQSLEAVGNIHSGETVASYIQAEFAGPSFRLYTNDDVVGVELAGAMKNVMAIAAGACQGLGLGTNAIAALITRGLAETARLAMALGARAETLSGLAGLGDLVLTCTGSLSRNRQLGIELGKGRALVEIVASTRMVAEGVGTAGALLALAGEQQIELPITAQVNAILHHGKSPRDAMEEIMGRPQKRE
ncbi:MAG TPA: NAD(P)H-dependent glycerol-3-phosphate dehydrogenase [Candidatus Acidoferrum sp.]|jgi:glycerol-3-phosphate dehydrogenase (NAD(P)+)|nr:NAD(P)H-dependent glycerol-3-phosphate dehydrogenase [Candidatus Acidoferrum sp.]